MRYQKPILPLGYAQQGRPLIAGEARLIARTRRVQRPFIAIRWRGLLHGCIMDHDIIIVGGGPAGLSFARALAGSGLRIAIVERQQRSARRSRL